MRKKIMLENTVEDGLDIYIIQKLLAGGTTIFDLPLSVTYYARVSTDDEDQIHSLHSQIRYYTDFIGKNANWTLVDGYFDEGITGTSVKKRDNFNRMLADARLHKFNLILTKEISRFSRNTVDSIQYTRELLSLGIGVFFQSDNINTLLPDSELRLTIMASMAQEESRKTHERIKFGNRRSIENGVVLGNNRFYGYDKDHGKLVINEREAEMIRIMYDLYVNERYGFRKIARALYDKGYRSTNDCRIADTTIKRCLQNPKYKGMYCGGKSTKFSHMMPDVKRFPEEEWVMYKDETGETVPAIVSEELWDKANAILESRSEYYRKQATHDVSFRGTYAYSGKIICEEHNATYCHAVYRNKKKDGSVTEEEVWQCKEYVVGGKKACANPNLHTRELDAIMRDIAQSLIENKQAIIEKMEHIYLEAAKRPGSVYAVAELQTGIEKAQKKKEKLLELVMEDLVSKKEFESRNTMYNTEIEAAKAQIEQLQNQEQVNQLILSQTVSLRQAIESEFDFPDGFSRGMVDTLVDRIVVKKGSVKTNICLDIYLRFKESPTACIVERHGRATSIRYPSEVLSSS